MLSSHACTNTHTHREKNILVRILWSRRLDSHARVWPARLHILLAHLTEALHDTIAEVIYHDSVDLYCPLSISFEVNKKFDTFRLDYHLWYRLYITTLPPNSSDHIVPPDHPRSEVT